MNNDSTLSNIKHFLMTNQLIEYNLGELESSLGIDLGRSTVNIADIESKYYPQIDQDLRADAHKMAPFYEIFYSLERSIRRTISDVLNSEYDEWWDEKVPQVVKDNVGKAIKKELDSGITMRSSENIDYCDFGELGEIIKYNWDLFGSIFRSVHAVEGVMRNLNTLRNTIAHCGLLAEDEQLRLRLTVRDWFRLME